MTGVGGQRFAADTGTGDGDGDGESFATGAGDERRVFLTEAIPESGGSVSGLALADRI